MKVKATPQVSLQQWKRQHAQTFAKAGKSKAKDSVVTPESHGLTSMFVPTRTDGNDFYEITTRKEFLDTNIETWLKWNVYRGLAITFGVATLWLLTVNPLVAVGCGLLTGWCYGWFYRNDKSIDLLRKRDLLEAV